MPKTCGSDVRSTARSARDGPPVRRIAHARDFGSHAATDAVGFSAENTTWSSPSTWSRSKMRPAVANCVHDSPPSGDQFAEGKNPSVTTRSAAPPPKDIASIGPYPPPKPKADGPWSTFSHDAPPSVERK